MFDETVSGTLDHIIGHFSKKEVKGEIVIVVSGTADRKKKHTEEEEADDMPE
jgi:16S rRNA C1402 (ribose-2'-O) methylase RsmI